MILQPCNTLKVHKGFLRPENLQGKPLTDDLARVSWESFGVWKEASSRLSFTSHSPLRPSSNISNIQSHSRTFHLVWLRFFSKLFTRACVPMQCVPKFGPPQTDLSHSFPAQYWDRQFVILVQTEPAWTIFMRWVLLPHHVTGVVHKSQNQCSDFGWRHIKHTEQRAQQEHCGGAA